MTLDKLQTLLLEHYEPQAFKDYAPQGLIIEGRKRIRKGMTAVSFSLAAVQKAVETGADFLVVHHPHGFWNNQPRQLCGGFRDKVALMLAHEISLFGFHLPMDAQPSTGNNIQVAQALGLEPCGSFLPNGQRQIGLLAKYANPVRYSVFKQRIEEVIGPIHAGFQAGKAEIGLVAVCTGGAAGSIREAMETGADLFLTGEPKEDTAIFCADEHFNFIGAGHHATEVFGPKALAHWLNEVHGIESLFVNIHNPV